MLVHVFHLKAHPPKWALAQFKGPGHLGECLRYYSTETSSISDLSSTISDLSKTLLHIYKTAEKLFKCSAFVTGYGGKVYIVS